jgi:16S rRNA (adenine1518-N6/adenine1519-N6)-dimethyltransferase
VPVGRPDGGGERPDAPGAGAPPDLGSARQVRALLARHGLTPDKGLGQNFLIDRRALEAVVAAADPPPGAAVLEVGPGLGALTRALAERGARVLALELDARLLPALRETTDRFPERVEVRRLDALRFDHREMPSGSYLASNLPYQIATALLAEALASGRYRRIGVLVQREVAERIVAGPGDPGFGAFSLICRHFAEARIVRTVGPGCFLPPPKVTSAVVRLEPRPGVAADPATFGLIRAGFRHRRKTLRKNLTAAGLEPERVTVALEELGLDPRVRAEALDLDAWRALRARLPIPPGPDARSGTG